MSFSNGLGELGLGELGDTNTAHPIMNVLKYVYRVSLICDLHDCPLVLG